jgi:CheY-like chemotaxis protein
MQRILVVDDDPAVLACYGKLLLRAGHEVETAPGGESALTRLGGDRAFDVVIIDYRMPGMDGMELLRRMRRMGHTPEVILVSAYVTDEVRASAACMGVRTILSKPIDVEQLRRAIGSRGPLVRSAESGC